MKVIRVLEYEGPRKWVEATLANNGVKGEHRISRACVIREISVTKEVYNVRDDGAQAKRNSGGAGFNLIALLLVEANERFERAGAPYSDDEDGKPEGRWGGV